MCEDPDVLIELYIENVRTIVKENIWISFNLIIECCLRHIREISRY